MSLLAPLCAGVKPSAACLLLKVDQSDESNSPVWEDVAVGQAIFGFVPPVDVHGEDAVTPRTVPPEADGKVT